MYTVVEHAFGTPRPCWGRIDPLAKLYAFLSKTQRCKLSGQEPVVQMCEIYKERIIWPDLFIYLFIGVDTDVISWIT